MQRHNNFSARQNYSEVNSYPDFQYQPTSNGLGCDRNERGQLDGQNNGPVPNDISYHRESPLGFRHNSRNDDYERFGYEQFEDDSRSPYSRSSGNRYSRDSYGDEYCPDYGNHSTFNQQTGVYGYDDRYPSSNHGGRYGSSDQLPGSYDYPTSVPSDEFTNYRSSDYPRPNEYNSQNVGSENGYNASSESSENRQSSGNSSSQRHDSNQFVDGHLPESNHFQESNLTDINEFLAFLDHQLHGIIEMNIHESNITQLDSLLALLTSLLSRERDSVSELGFSHLKDILQSLYLLKRGRRDNAQSPPLMADSCQGASSSKEQSPSSMESSIHNSLESTLKEIATYLMPDSHSSSRSGECVLTQKPDVSTAKQSLSGNQSVSLLDEVCSVIDDSSLEQPDVHVCSLDEGISCLPKKVNSIDVPSMSSHQSRKFALENDNQFEIPNNWSLMQVVPQNNGPFVSVNCLGCDQMGHLETDCQEYLPKELGSSIVSNDVNTCTCGTVNNDDATMSEDSRASAEDIEHGQSDHAKLSGESTPHMSILDFLISVPPGCDQGALVPPWCNQVDNCLLGDKSPDCFCRWVLPPWPPPQN